MKKRVLDDLVTYRKSLGENQSVFWSRFGVTQSGGSRYESGRELPRPVALLVLAHKDKYLSESDFRKLAEKV